MSKSAHALVFCRLFSYTISLVSLGEAILSFFYFYGTSARAYVRTARME